MAHLSSVYRRFEEGAKRLTPQRELILKIFLQRPGEPLSADDVRQLVQPTQDVASATVYRTLELFSQLGIVVDVAVA